MTDIVNSYTNIYDEVVLMHGSNKENERKLDSRIKLDMICAYDRSSTIKRIFTWVKGTWQIYRKLKKQYKEYEIVYVTNPPMGYLCSLKLKNPFSVIVFDTYPDALANIGIRTGNPIFNLWRKWNMKLFARAKNIFTLSNGMAERLSNYISRDKITVVPCWSANSQFAPISKASNPFVKEHRLEDKFVVMYSGNMGVTHNVQLLVECAKRLKENTKIHFMLIGGGTKKPELEAIVKVEGLTNFTFMDWLPADVLPYSLAAADLGAISLNDDTALVSVPSKTYNLFAVGAPLLCIASEKTELYHLISQYKNGKCFDKNDIQGMVDFILELYNNAELKAELSNNSLNASTHFTYKNAEQYVNI